VVKKVSAEGKPPNRRITLGFADSSRGRLFFARRLAGAKRCDLFQYEKVYADIMFPYSLAIILLAPLLAGLVLGLLGRGIGMKAGRIGVAAEVFALTLALLLLFEVITSGPRTIQMPGWNGGLQFAFFIDRLSAVMLVHIAAIGILIHAFSIRYMQQERGYARFHSLLAFTTFTLFGMVSSGNLLMLLVFWQLLSWLLPLLSYNYQHPPTVRGAFRTFIMQRAGDAAFLAAVVLAYGWYGTLDLQQLFARAAAGNIVVSLWPGGLEFSAATAVTFFIFIGAMAKSAQFPLHMWLPDSLYAPTPVHALLHAGIINAGGFLLARLAPLFGLSPVTLHLVFAVGMLTTLLGSSMMLVQSDIKKTLGYSTIGQMGFMIMECGVGAYGLAIFHLIAHGLFKGSIFLNCGYVIHAARKEPRFPPKHEAVESAEFSSLTWLTGFVTTLILPLIIVLAAHGILNIPLRDSQGTAIFLFFGWATSSQAILTLYRLRAVASWKVAVSMLSVLFVVVLTYLLAAESFTHFLFPAPGEVAAHFKAGALPVPAFDLLVAIFALVIIFGWYLIYAKSHGRTIRTPEWFHTLQVRVYLFLLNRLYLDALSMRLRTLVTSTLNRLNASKAFGFVVTLIAIVVALFSAHLLPELPATEMALIAFVALLLPLYPMHGVYIAALTRTPGFLAVALAALMPAAGLYGLANLLPKIPAQVLPAISALALFGALYGSLKALAQTRLPQLLAYAALAFFSALWWHAAVTGTVAAQAVVYAAAVILFIAALLLAWQRMARRYGDLTLERMRGLARPMPRFAAVLSLLVMAGVGLPPFGLFSSYAAMLLQPAISSSGGLIIILLCWFLASWYLFRMMQRLLFGPHRADIRYEDLHSRELACFAFLLLVLALLGATPPEWLESNLFVNGQRIAMEMMPWRK
jgi:NADH-quinone oxidoreductase subunit L